MNISSGSKAVTEDVESAALALSLGLAANALASSMSFFTYCSNAVGPAGERDRLSSCLMTLALLQEARLLIQSEFPRVSRLAERGGATGREIKSAMKAMNDRAVSDLLPDIRNQLIFHWDRRPMATWAKSYAGKYPRWIDSGNGSYSGLHHGLAASAVMEIAFGSQVASLQDDDAREAAIRELFKKLALAVEAVLGLIHRAVEGHVVPYTPHLDRRASSTESPAEQGLFNFIPPDQSPKK